MEEFSTYKHLHFLCGVNSLIEINHNFKINILNKLKNNVNWYVVLNKLTRFDISKQKFVYLIKYIYNWESHKFIFETYISENCFNFISFLYKYKTNYNYGSINNNSIYKNTKITLYNLIKINFYLKKWKIVDDLTNYLIN